MTGKYESPLALSDTGVESSSAGNELKNWRQPATGRQIPEATQAPHDTPPRYTWHFKIHPGTTTPISNRAKSGWKDVRIVQPNRNHVNPDCLISVFITSRPKIEGENNKSLPDLAVEQGTNGGWEFANLSLPAPTLGAPFRGCPWFPRRHSPRQAGVFGLVAGAGPSSAFRPLDFGVRLFSSLRLMVAPPACKPGQDTPVIFFSRLGHWLRVSHRFWRCVRPQPRVSPLHSQVALYLQSSGVVFNIAGARKFFHVACLAFVVFPVGILLLSRLSASFFG